MGKPKPHAGFTKKNEWHKDKENGCIYKHRTKKDDPCDYAKNGFDDVENKKFYARSIYNLDYQARAKFFGYIEGNVVNEQKIQQQHIDVKASQYSGEKAKPPEWKKKWKKRLAQPFEQLAKHEKAWDIKFSYPYKVKPWWGLWVIARAKIPPAENYKPKRYGGWHYFYPVKHNWHHIIPAGEFSNLVISGEKSDDRCTPERRAMVVIHKDMIGWNINNKKNVILLPCEEPHAFIMQLPSHCPYGLPNHNNYINTIKKELDEVRKTIDKAITDGTWEGGHLKDVTIAKDTIAKAEKKLFKKLIKMKDVNQ
ncbi:uncharacterized protein Dvar_59850 [Desulfosarcina variabilis str. Montpellier]|uniref:AHH domain-containing protein n=1 Tax=Desulfosarcina variabilis TaxID=2300 RepID=UPI003AFB234E